MKPTKKIAPIVILDDEEDLCILLRNECKTKHDSNVLTSGNLEDARKLLDYNPWLVFVDHNLPDGKGLDFVREIRAKDKEIVIVMMTAQVNGSLKELALETGINYFLPKPFNIKKIDELLEGFRPEDASYLE